MSRQNRLNFSAAPWMAEVGAGRTRFRRFVRVALDRRPRRDRATLARVRLARETARARRALALSAMHPIVLYVVFALVLAKKNEFR
jgi:hypothetical protein